MACNRYRPHVELLERREAPGGVLSRQTLVGDSVFRLAGESEFPWIDLASSYSNTIPHVHLGLHDAAISGNTAETPTSGFFLQKMKEFSRQLTDVAGTEGLSDGRSLDGLGVLPITSGNSTIAPRPMGVIGGGLVSTTGGGLGTARVVASQTSAPGNDNQTTWSKQNFYSLDVTFAANSSIDMVFAVTDSTPASISEYDVEMDVQNQTGANWTGFHWELGFMVQGAFQTSACDLDMDWPNKDPTPSIFTTTPFQTLNHQQYTIDWSNGTVGNTKSVSFFFAVDVPNSTNVPQGAKTANGYQFVIRGQPTAGGGGGGGGQFNRPALGDLGAPLRGHP
jgi:hypothetical protein